MCDTRKETMEKSAEVRIQPGATIHRVVSDVEVRVRWGCPLCGESFHFHPHDIDVIDFFAARHFVRRHKMDPIQAAEYATDLRDILAERGPGLEECLIRNNGADANHPQE